MKKCDLCGGSLVHGPDNVVWIDICGKCREVGAKWAAEMATMKIKTEGMKTAEARDKECLLLRKRLRECEAVMTRLWQENITLGESEAEKLIKGIHKAERSTRKSKGMKIGIPSTYLSAGVQGDGQEQVEVSVGRR